jgi:hypothetical protein
MAYKNITSFSIEGISTKLMSLSQRAGAAGNRYRAALENGPGGIIFEQGGSVGSDL